MAEYKKLKPEHPLYKKVLEIEDLMEKLGVRILAGSNGQIYVEDTKTELLVKYMDIEQQVAGDNNMTTTFPYCAEWKLVIKE